MGKLKFTKKQKKINNFVTNYNLWPKHLYSENLKEKRIQIKNIKIEYIFK